MQKQIYDQCKENIDFEQSKLNNSSAALETAFGNTQDKNFKEFEIVSKFFKGTAQSGGAHNFADILALFNKTMESIQNASNAKVPMKFGSTDYTTALNIAK